MPAGTVENPTIAQDVVDAFDAVFGLHPGFRPAHAKGVMCTGTFTPSAESQTLTRAPYSSRPSTPVTVRFSDSTGIPNIADNDPHSSPKGMAIRFHLAEHVHTDIVAHSADGFPVRTGEEFLQMLRVAAAAQHGEPQAMAAFFAAHPHAKEFAEAARPIPTSFARESFFAVTAFRFINSSGVSRHGRIRIRPRAGTQYLSNEQAASQSANFLVEEIEQRLNQGPATFNLSVQIAESGDDVADATAAWPSTRSEIPFGTIMLTAVVDGQTPERRKIIFDPVPRVDGIEPSGDPLTEVRADVYLVSGRRRRAVNAM